MNQILVLRGLMSIGVWWAVWDVHGFWWGVWYGLFWEVWVGYRLAKLLAMWSWM